MQIDYTSRDFAGLKADLIALIGDRTNTAWDPTDYSDLGHVMVEAFAYMGDVMSHYLDRIANETTIDTAVQKSTLLALANAYDYKPSGPTPAAVQLIFTNVGLNSIDIPIGTQVLAPLSFGPYSQVFFETTQSATALAVGASITLTAQEGKTVNTDRPDLIDSTYNKPLPANLGSSNGFANQQFNIVDPGVIDSSITVYVGQGSSFNSWTYQDNLLEYGPNDNVFTTSRNEDDTVNIVFGDAVNGAIPASGQLISSTYKTSVGTAGNVKSLAVTDVTFIPGNLDVQAPTYLTVTNTLPASGGANSDSTDQLKAKIKASISARRRAITTTDFAKLALQVSQVGKANASTPGVYSSVNLYVQIQNDTSATPGYYQGTIIGAVGSAGTVTYTTQYAHNFVVGDVVNISGINPTAYNLSGQTITAITTVSPYTFSVANAATGTYVSGGYAVDLTPTPAWTTVQTAVKNYMADKTLVGTTLTVQPPVYVPVYLAGTVTVSPSYKNADIKLAIYQALLGAGGLFYYDNNIFGDYISVSTVTAAIQAIPGVLSASITQLSLDGSASAADRTLTAGQIPFLTASMVNAGFTPTGGIS
jgi:hypothetical protein